MGDNISVNTDKLGVAIPQVQELADRVNAIRAELNGTLDGLGECWGGKDDSIGKPFDEGYTPAQGQIDLGLIGTKDAFESTGNRVHTWALGLQRTEENNTINVPKTSTNDGSPEHHPLP